MPLLPALSALVQAVLSAQVRAAEGLKVVCAPGLLFEEMESLGPDVPRHSEWKHTSMKGPVTIFRKFVEGLSVENRQRKKELGGLDEAVDFLSDAMDVDS